MVQLSIGLDGVNNAVLEFFEFFSEFSKGSLYLGRLGEADAPLFFLVTFLHQLA